jgi:hypothetical protein
VIYPLEDQFYAERGGRLRDPFGQQKKPRDDLQVEVAVRSAP